MWPLFLIVTLFWSISAANIYFKSHLWQMKREPIKTPFLPKQKESDYYESLAIFKLILRFMNDNSLGGMREKILADYIANKGIQNEKLRDEIFCQLANQTWKMRIKPTVKEVYYYYIWQKFSLINNRIFI